MVLLAAFQVLLYRYTGQDEILVGSPTSGRTKSEFASILGHLVDFMVMRADLSDNPSFQIFLAQVRQTVLGALAHQDYPFALLVERLQPERDPSCSPIFQASFVLQNFLQAQETQKLYLDETKNRIEWGGIEVETFAIDHFEGQYDLSLELTEINSKLVGAFKYNVNLFDEQKIVQMASHFQALLTGIVASPEQTLEQLPLLTQAQQQQILVDWNQTVTDYPSDQCMHQLFEAQVQDAPDAVAVIFEDQKFTYAELNTKANQLAYYLQQQGVGPGVLVGICVERSLEMIVGLLGILKAGGAYVPLDPNYPQSRLDYMIQDAQISVLLTQQQWHARLMDAATQVVYIDTLAESLSSTQQSNLSVPLSADHNAYLMYTSGSTGQPKGVLIRHRGVVRLVKNTNYIQLGAEDRILQLAPISFDAATFEIWGALLNGGQLVVMPSHQPSLAEIGAAIAQHHITTLWLTAGLFQLMVEEHLEDLRPLKYLLAGGDILSVPHVQQILDNLEGCQLINGYGPTENTTFTCCFPVTKTSDLSKSVPIGKAIANTQVYILDRHLNPVPIGVPGELHIGGDGLAAGYHNRPKLTQEKFIPNPFIGNSKFKIPNSEFRTARSSAGPTPNSVPLGRPQDLFRIPNSPHLYKTGDLARYLPDGNIEFLGRIDEQVKIRGFRIETGEIEAILSQYPHVQQVIVIALEDDLGQKRLVAYVVSDNPSISPPEICQFLQQQVPDYMVPAAVLILETLPLTPNGKVDRQALPSPDLTRSLTTEFIAPRTPTEQAIAEIWSTVLGVEAIGIHDDFFALGGHSLLATQVVSRLQQTFGLQFPLRQIFDTPTVKGLGESLTVLQTNSLGDGIQPSISPIARQGPPPPLSFAQQRLWFLEKTNLTGNAYHMPLLLHLNGQLQLMALKESLNQLILRHEPLRTRFAETNGTPYQIIGEPFTLELPILDLSELPSAQRSAQLQQVLQQENQTLFNLEVDPPIRAQLFRLSSTEHVLAVTVHHIAADGWSLTVLSQDLSAFYQAALLDQSSALPALPVQYADFAVWQRRWLQGHNLDVQLDYWKQKLWDLSPLQLPTDHPRPAIESFRGAGQPIEISAPLTAQLKQLSQQAGTTLFMTLLAVLKALLVRYCGQEEIAVGSPIANRNHHEIENLIGFFVNSLVLYTDLSGDPSFREVLSRVRQTALEAYAHQDLPFEKLVEELQPERSLSRNPLYQIAFALQQQEALVPDFRLPDLDVSWYQESGVEMTVRMDLELHLWPQEEELRGLCVYNRDLFEAATIERMLSHYQNLLTAIAADPDQPISTLPLLTAQEQQQLLVNWNQTRAHYPSDKCIHQLFEAQVDAAPDAIAVVFENQSLSYSELDAKANQLAHYLQRLDVKPDVLVGICVERSLEMFVAILGVLKAGGAYVPLDPDYPPERLRYMLTDAQATVLLTQQALLAQLPSHNTPVVCLDRDWDTIATESSANITIADPPPQLAYVIYTSGSTGKPKGVRGTHQGVCNLSQYQIQTFNVGPGSHILQFSSLSFDASVWEMAEAFCSGASLHLRPREKMLPGPDLCQWMADQQITHIDVPPSALAVMTPDALPALQRVIASGEPCPTKVIDEWSQGRQFFNAYGPTEYTVCATIGEQSPDYPYPPIGRPLANTQIYILDRHLNPVPIGVAGELHIGGEGLALGYHNRPDLTQEKFIPNPFVENSKFKIQNSKFKIPHSPRLYKTGDLARYLPDGNIEFLGRIDHQVKVRGFRIETGEIETKLNQNLAVKEAVVLAREDTPGDKRLIAYVVPQLDTDTLEQPELADTQVSHWQDIFNQQPRSASDVSDPLFNTQGWLSSYDNQLIPETQMRVWADDIVSQVLAHHPQRVWEIGCGAGTLLFQIAPHIQAYHGTDISDVSLDYVRQQMRQQPDHYGHVTLAQQRADDMGEVADNSFDVILLSSIVQYFPTIHYLLQVIENSMRAVKPGGKIVLGDVRSYPLMRAFHTSVQCYKATPSLDSHQLQQRVERQMLARNGAIVRSSILCGAQG